MSLTENYLSIPKRLLIELRDTPLAIAIYFFVARLYLVQQRPVLLSRDDIRKFDPSLKVGAIKRALDRLIQAGWLIEKTGYKSSYTPVWGKRRGTDAPYLWDINAPHHLGCPKHLWISAIRVDRTLLDLFMGKFTPHLRNSYTESYFTRPLLSLADIGAYMLIAAALPAEATQELERWGLVRDGQAQNIPDDDIVLALASQRTSLLDGFQLTTAGWRRLGWFDSRSSQPTQQTGAKAVPLIFVPKERIGSLIPILIGESIGCSTSSEIGNTAAECAQTVLEIDTANISGIIRDSRDSREAPPSPPIQQLDGGGAISLEKENDRGSELPDTEAARVLFAFGVNDPTCLVELATMPIEQVGGAIAYAEAEDLGPGWVVTALRRHRDEAWPLPRVRRKPTGGSVDWDGEVARYGDLFGRGSDTSDLGVPDRADRVRLDDHAHTPEVVPRRVQPGRGTAAHARPPNLVQLRPLESAPGLSSQPAARRSALELTQELRSRMVMQCDRSYRRVINGLQVRVADDTTVIQCASLADHLAVLDALMGALRWIVADLGLPRAIHITDRPPNGMEPPCGGGQPTTDVPLSA